MSEKEKKEVIESISEQFVGLDEIDKVYITGYVAGKQEERRKWEKGTKETAVATV